MRLSPAATLCLSAALALGPLPATAQPAPASGGARPAPSAFAAQAAQEAGAVITESGLVYREVKAGNGDPPKATDMVRVHYRGTLADGKEFDSSYKRNELATFPLNKVIPCWTEGLQRMRPGGSARLTCPPELAYGARGVPGVIPANATLRFEVELFSVLRP